MLLLELTAPFFETFVFLDGLVVEVLAVHDEQHLVDAIHVAGELRRLETCQRLAAACGMPHVSTRLGRAESLRIVFADENAVENAFGGRDLVRAHHQQVMLGGEHAISRQDIEQCMPGEEGSGETRQVGDDVVAPVGPPAGEFETVGALLRTACCGTALHFMDVLEARGVAVVLGVRAVRDDEDLGVLIESRSGPEAVALVTVDLVERLLDRHAPSLQLDLHQRQAIDQNRHIIAVIMPCAVCLFYLILVDDLQAVVMDVLFVDQRDIFGAAIILVQHLYIVFLNLPGLFRNMLGWGWQLHH